MSGTLTKRLPPDPVYVAGSPGSPGYPGEPERPAYSYTQSVERCTYVFVDMGAAPIRTGGVSGRLGYWAYVCRMVDEVVNVPAQPAKPAVPAVPPSPGQWLSATNTGWTAGANTVDVLPGDGEFAFRVPTAAGAVVGLTLLNDSTSPREASHAFQLMSGRYVPVESGAPAGSYALAAPSTVFKIRRTAGVVSYVVDGVVVGSSTLPSFGPVTLDASLYLAGDQVVYLGMAPSTDGRIVAVAPKPEVRAGVAYADITARAGKPLALMTGPTVADLYATAPQPLMFAGSGFNVGEIKARAAAATVVMDSGLPEPDYALMTAVAANPQAAMTGLTGGVGSITAVARPAFAIASEQSYGYCAAVAPGNYSAYMLDGGPRAMLYDAAVFVADAEGYRYMAVAFNSTGALLGELTSSRVLSATMDAGILASFSTQLSSILGARFSETLSFGDGAGGRRTDSGGTRAEDEVTWALNYETGAYSEYAGFGFDAMYERSGLYFGTRGAEVYLLSGDDDDGTPIDAFVAFGKQNFGDTLIKQVPNVYAGVSSTGVLLLRVTVGEKTYTYRARRNDQTTRAQRYDLGRGLRGSYYEFELFNEAGADFELDSIEFAVVPTARRI